MTNNTIGKTVEFPPTLTKECDELIKKNFSKYGNSWKNNFTTGWWESRLFEEFIELKKAPNHWERRKELLDIINIARMFYYNEDGGCAF